jgi:hypothetical protein
MWLQCHRRDMPHGRDCKPQLVCGACVSFQRCAFGLRQPVTYRMKKVLGQLCCWPTEQVNAALFRGLFGHGTGVFLTGLRASHFDFRNVN